jgi:hypothetical protein
MKIPELNKKNKNRIYTFTVDSKLDETLKNFEAQLTDKEEIVSTSVVENKLIVVTKERKTTTESKKLLLENR